MRRHLRARLDRSAVLAGLLGAGLLAASVIAGSTVSACSAKPEDRRAARLEPAQAAPEVAKSEQSTDAASGKMNPSATASGTASSSGGDMSAKVDPGTLNPAWADIPKDASGKVTLTEMEWSRRLDANQYGVLRGKGTERAFSGKLWNTNEPGEYRCAGCGNLLFAGESKFISECGWPAFDRAIKGSIEYHKDDSYGMSRVEVTCAKCGGHLGHVFDDGPTATGTRYCINSISIAFIPKSQIKDATIPEQEAKTEP